MVDGNRGKNRKGGLSLVLRDLIGNEDDESKLDDDKKRRRRRRRKLVRMLDVEMRSSINVIPRQEGNQLWTRIFRTNFQSRWIENMAKTLIIRTRWPTRRNEGIFFSRHGTQSLFRGYGEDDTRWCTDRILRNKRETRGSVLFSNPRAGGCRNLDTPLINSFIQRGGGSSDEQRPLLLFHDDDRPA